VTRNFEMGGCEHCQHAFLYYLIHSGFNNCWYAYCDRCGMTAILDFWDRRRPKLVDCPEHQAICAAMEPYLAPCACGVAFRRDASPRCPSCNEALSAGAAASYIEHGRTDWRWQRSWTALYCIVIGEKVVHDNFLQRSGVEDECRRNWQSQELSRLEGYTS
jgi:hypothetical protein